MSSAVDAGEDNPRTAPAAVRPSGLHAPLDTSRLPRSLSSPSRRPRMAEVPRERHPQPSPSSGIGPRARPRWPTPCCSRPRPSTGWAAWTTAPASPTSTTRSTSTTSPSTPASCTSTTRASTSTSSTPPATPTSSAPPWSALNAVETAVIVVSAVNGIEVNTRRMFNEAGKRGLARLLVINKLDADNVHFAELLAAIQRDVRQGVRPVQRPDGVGAELHGRRQRPRPAGDGAGRLPGRPRRRPRRSWSTPSSRPTRR